MVRRSLTRPNTARGALAVVMAIPVLCSAACGTESVATGRPTGPDVVTVAGDAFSPGIVAIKAGQSVTWFFDDGGRAHTVVGTGAAASKIHSPMITAGQYTLTFDQSGTYPYICTLHPNMSGTIIVR